MHTDENLVNWHVLIFVIDCLFWPKSGLGARKARSPAQTDVDAREIPVQF
jgi:hypothetical protein